MIVKATVDFGRLCGKQQLWFLRLGSGFHPWLGSFGANNPLDPKTTPFMGENWLLYGEMNSTFGLKNWLHCLRLILIILVGLVWSTETWVDFQSSWLVLSDQPKLIFDFFSAHNCNDWWFYSEYFGFHQFLFALFSKRNKTGLFFTLLKIVHFFPFASCVMT